METQKNEIDIRYWKYIRQGVTLMAVLFFLTLVLAMSYPSVTLPLIVSAVYALFVEIGAVTAWRKVATVAPDSLPSVFLAISGGRFMLALVVMFVYFLLVGKIGKGDMLTFVLIFAAFYLSAVLHHTLFFTHKHNTLRKRNRRLHFI